MTLPKQIFQFHDIATVEVSTDSQFARSFYNAEYGYHSIKPDTSQTQLSAMALNNLPHAFLDFRQKSSTPEGNTHHTHKILARWNYNLSIKPGSIDMQVNGNRVAVSLVHHTMLHPSLRWLSCNNETLLLHAGAVVKNNKSLIFTGKGGTGKTTTTSLILASDHGWQIHADDYVFLKNEQSKAYITRSHLYRDLQKWVPEVRTRLTNWERVRLQILGAVREYSREGIKWPVRVNLQQLWPKTKIANTATPAAILLLERKDVSHPTLNPVNSIEETINDLLDMNFGEARHFINLIKKTGEFDPDWLNAWKETERNLIESAIGKIPTYKLTLPLSNSAKEIEAGLIPLIDELVKE